MKKVFIYTFILILCILIIGCREDQSIVLQNAKIINVETGKVETFNLLIEGPKILKISKNNLSGNNLIDLNGKYIMPSLWDMHVHIHKDKKKLDDFFKNGILGVRDMGAFKMNEVDSLVKWHGELKTDPSIAYPEIVYSGFINNDITCYEGHRNVTTFDELVASTSFLKEIGSSFYKVHNCFPHEMLPQLDSIATKEDFYFGGHIPQGVDPIEYVTQFDRINSIEHVSVLLRGLTYRKKDPLNMLEAISLLDGHYLDSLAGIMKMKNISFTPNLYSEQEFIRTYPEDKKQMGEAFLKRLMQYTKRLYEADINILAGTDTGQEIEAGKSLHQELQLLSQAGLSNLEVLQTATINCDNALGRNPNLIEENAMANFIILNENPLEDLSALQDIYGVSHYGILSELN